MCVPVYLSLTWDARLTTLNCTGRQVQTPFITMALAWGGGGVLSARHIKPQRLKATVFHEGGTFKGKQWCKLKRGGQPKLAPTREPAVPHTPLVFQVWAKRLLLFPGVHRAALTAHQTLPFHSPLTSLFVWSARVIKFPSGFPTETLANKGRDIFAENHKERKKKKKKTQTLRKKKGSLIWSARDFQSSQMELGAEKAQEGEKAEPSTDTFTA